MTTCAVVVFLLSAEAWRQYLKESFLKKYLGQEVLAPSRRRLRQEVNEAHWPNLNLNICFN